MGRSKIKTKSVKSTVGNKDILDMFQNMVVLVANRTPL